MARGSGRVPFARLAGTLPPHARHKDHPSQPKQTPSEGTSILLTGVQIRRLGVRISLPSLLRMRGFQHGSLHIHIAAQRRHVGQQHSQLSVRRGATTTTVAEQFWSGAPPQEDKAPHHSRHRHREKISRSGKPLTLIYIYIYIYIYMYTHGCCAYLNPNL